MSRKSGRQRRVLHAPRAPALLRPPVPLPEQQVRMGVAPAGTTVSFHFSHKVSRVLLPPDAAVKIGLDLIQAAGVAGYPYVVTVTIEKDQKNVATPSSDVPPAGENKAPELPGGEAG